MTDCCQQHVGVWPPLKTKLQLCLISMVTMVVGVVWVVVRQSILLTVFQQSGKLSGGSAHCQTQEGVKGQRHHLRGLQVRGGDIEGGGGVRGKGEEQQMSLWTESQLWPNAPWDM